jgi:tRNA-2-methylthio-N6-dimethylallyladenosine synthase
MKSFLKLIAIFTILVSLQSCIVSEKSLYNEEIKIRRLNEMIELQNQLSAESNAKDVGKTFEVLVEGVSKRSKEQLFGRTEQNKVVVFDRGSHRIGDFVKVKITESSSATLKGIEVTE